MVFKEIEKMGNVAAVYSYKEEIFYNTSQNLYKNNTILASKVEGKSFWFYNDCVFYYSIEDELGIIYPDGNCKLFKNWTLCNVNLNNEIWVCIDTKYNKGDFTFVYAKYNLLTGELTEQGEVANTYVLYVDNLNTIFRRDNLINCIVNNREIWKYDLSNLGKNPLFNDNRDDKFSKFLGIVGERIFLLSEANRVVVLNLNDGSLVHVFNVNCEELPNMRDAFIHPEDKNIYCLADHFVELNTETLNIERNIRIVEDNHDPNVNTILYGIKNSSHQGDLISFTSFTRHRVGFDKWVGLFDYIKEEVVWHYELLPAEGQLSIPAGETPQLAGDKLYILDTDDTLHILEREGTL